MRHNNPFKKPLLRSLSVSFLIGGVALFSLIYVLFMPSIFHAPAPSAAKKIEFWDQQRKGANIFNKVFSREDIRAAKNYRVQFIRLAPDKFGTSARDFLIGDADNFTGIIKEDLLKFKEILDACHEEGMPVIITMLSLPGSRWRQNNHFNDDLRIWNDDKFQQQAAEFWKSLAQALKGHPAIVGYNILNEPHLEKLFQPSGPQLPLKTRKEIQNQLFTFYHAMIESIRAVDQDTPIILDGSTYGDPQEFEFFKPHADNKILYSFHMYEPYQYTNYKLNQGKLSYPGKIGAHSWNLEALKTYIEPVVRFQKTHKIPSSRILVGEFGGSRFSKGIEKYFEDLIKIFNQESWHFAFYAFREDVWDSMDYELGTQKLPWSYWQTEKSKRKIPPALRSEHSPAFQVIKNDL